MHFIIVLYFIKLNHTGLIFWIASFICFCGADITLSTFSVGFLPGKVKHIYIRHFEDLPKLSTGTAWDCVGCPDIKEFFLNARADSSCIWLQNEEFTVIYKDIRRSPRKAIPLFTGYKLTVIPKEVRALW